MNVLIFLCFISFSPTLFAASKSSSQGNVSWNLLDYLSQKRAISLQDLWLVKNKRKTDLFEGYANGGYMNYKYRNEDSVAGASATTDKNSQNYRLALYVWRFGLEGEYEKTNQSMVSSSGAAAFRLLGTSNKDTSLTVKYGLRQLVDQSEAVEEKWSNQFAEGSLVLYLISFFGIHGDYRHYFPDASSAGTDLSGHKTTAGAFFDIGPLRIYADYFQENMEYVKTSSIKKTEREGFDYGARLFF
ncbi:MAG: hypothetical protein AB7N80_00675 [Bdellovibrionales bacterium]